jgi:hypothetical protein
MFRPPNQELGGMYREAPRNEIDSGWHFFSGDETQEYADHPGNFALYDVNTIANYDPGIITLLDSPVGGAFGRGENGEFLSEEMPIDPEA